MFSHFNPETIALLTGVQKDVLRELVPCNAPHGSGRIARIMEARCVQHLVRSRLLGTRALKNGPTRPLGDLLQEPLARRGARRSEAT